MKKDPDYSININFVDYHKNMGYTKNLPNAKFKVNEEVKYIGNIEEYSGKTFKIGGMAYADDTFEYSLYNYPFLVWEEELEKI